MVRLEDDWQCPTQSLAEKQFLLDYARQRGVTVAPKWCGMESDDDLYISNFGGKIGLGSLPRRHDKRETPLIDSETLMRLCDEHAAALA